MEAEDDKPTRKRGRPPSAKAPKDAAAPSARKPRIAKVSTGSYVRKTFPSDAPSAPPVSLLGKVESCCGRQYTVLFEDGRREAFSLPEARQILVASVPEDDSEEMNSRKRKLDQMCCPVATVTPRTRSGKGGSGTVRRVAPADDRGVVQCNGFGNGAIAREVERLNSAEAAPSSSIPSSNLDDDADSCSDSCDSIRVGELDPVREDSGLRAVPLPPSSGDIDVPEDAVPYLFNVYSFLRSFSHQLFLSPFGFDEFVGSLNCTVHNNLLDAVHVSLLRTLRRHLEELSSDGSKLACRCLKCIDWNLLDTMTWPVFVVQYLLKSGHIKQVDKKTFLDGAFEGEYCSLSATLKLIILQILCDDVLDSLDLGMELSTRDNLDEDNEYNIDSNVALQDSGPRRVHPRYSKTSACKNPGSLEEAMVTGDPILSSKSIESDAKELNVGQDGNSDDCRLCGMEGTLVCCDGCPSAYHSRCISLNKSSLPDGPWFCPECTVKKMGPTSSRVSFGIRGAEQFGSDPFGRMFIGTCDYLLILEGSFDGKHASRYYNRRDVMKVLDALCLSRETSSLYASICKGIVIYWDIPLALTLDLSHHYKNMYDCMTVEEDAAVCSGIQHIALGKSDGEDQVGPAQNCRMAIVELPSQASQENSCLDAPPANDGSVLMDVDSQGRESLYKGLSSGRILDSDDPDKRSLCLQTKVSESINIVVANDHNLTDESSKVAAMSTHFPDAYKSRGQFSGSVDIKSLFKPYEYTNQYIPGEIAASAAANFAIVADERSKLLEANPSAKDRKNLSPMSTLQLKAFSEASMHFLWPSTDKKALDVPRERCGWCLACEAAATCKKGCLLNMAVLNTVRGYSKSPGFARAVKSGGSRLSSIAAYILYMEASFTGLLEGPFSDVYHNVQWRKTLSEISTFGALKYLLLEFVKNIRGVVFSNDWLKPLDDLSIEASNSQNGPSFSGSSHKRSLRGRRGKKRSAIFESTQSDSDENSGRVQWWSGGRLSKVVLRRGALPAFLAKKAARQGGSREVPGVCYNSKVLSITRQEAWRASVENSENYSQLAFQLRYLDAHLRWRDLSRPEITFLDGKLVDGEASAFRNANIVDERVVENHTQYAVTFGEQRHLPSRIMKCALETEPHMNGDKLWFSETFVPLYLIKEFEGKKVVSCLTSLCKVNANGLSVLPMVQHKYLQEDIFSYLFHKEERSGKSCISCKEYVPLRHAFKCQSCEGPCHRSCLKSSTVDFRSYICSVCYNVNPVKKDVVGHSKTRLQIPRLQVASQQNHATPESMIRKQSSLGAPEQLANIEEGSERGSLSAKANLERRNKNKCPNNGLVFKGKKVIYSCDPDFRTKHLILKGDVEMGTFIAPRCKLCSLPYNPNLMYIRCERCANWYHAESVQLEEHRVLDLVGFRCPTCRRRCSPICPYADPNSKKRQAKRNDSDAKQSRVAQVAPQTLLEPSDSMDMQFSQVKIEGTMVQTEMDLMMLNQFDSIDEVEIDPSGSTATQFDQSKMEHAVVPPERLEQASALMSDVSCSWPVPKSGVASKGKLPVRRHATSGIPIDANMAPSEAWLEPIVPPAETPDFEQEVDLEGFSIHEGDSSFSMDGTSFFDEDSDFPTADENMSAQDIEGNYQIYDSNDVGADGMEYEPQTYFSFTELIAAGEDQVDEMFDVDIPVEVPEDWQPSDASCFDDDTAITQTALPSYPESDELLAADGLECLKCGTNQPPADLSCEICGLSIHSHCSPWVEMEQPEDDGKWRCGGCREWR